MTHPHQKPSYNLFSFIYGLIYVSHVGREEIKEIEEDSTEIGSKGSKNGAWSRPRQNLVDCPVDRRSGRSTAQSTGVQPCRVLTFGHFVHSCHFMARQCSVCRKRIGRKFWSLYHKRHNHSGGCLAGWKSSSQNQPFQQINPFNS